jgi:2-iminobutanoate/2-iminopropanoate deaminase
MSDATRLNTPDVAPWFSAHAVRYGDLAFLSGCMPLDLEGRLVEGDFESQMHTTLGNLAVVLEYLGAGFGDVLRTTVWVTQIAERPTVRAVRTEYFGETRTAGTLVEVPRLAIPGAMVAIDCIAGVGSHERQEIKAPELEPQFSADAVRYGDFVFVTGCVATGREGNVVGDGDLAAQTRQTLENLRWSLRAAGADLGDVLKTNVYMTDCSQRALTYDIRTEFFGAAPPASTMLEVSALGRPELLIEIDAIAAA